MTVENRHPDEESNLQKLPGNKAALWVDDATGQIVELQIESRIRPGERGCQNSLEELNTTDKYGGLDFNRPPASIDLVGSTARTRPFPIPNAQRRVPALPTRRLLPEKGGNS